MNIEKIKRANEIKQLRDIMNRYFIQTDEHIETNHHTITYRAGVLDKFYLRLTLYLHFTKYVLVMERILEEKPYELFRGIVSPKTLDIIIESIMPQHNPLYETED